MGRGGGFDQFLLGMCHWLLRTPTPNYSIFFGALMIESINLSNFLADVILAIPMVAKFQNFPIPKILKMCDPILVALLKMQPQYTQFIPESATLSIDTSH